MEEQGIPVEQCVGVGVGFPGTVDPKSGVVFHSDSAKWKNIRLAEEVGKYLPIPVKIANEADCAALGAANLI